MIKATEIVNERTFCCNSTWCSDFNVWSRENSLCTCPPGKKEQRMPYMSIILHGRAYFAVKLRVTSAHLLFEVACLTH